MGMKAGFQSWSISGMSKAPKAQCLAGPHTDQAQVWWVKNTGFDGPKKGGARIFESRRRESRHDRKTRKTLNASSQTRSTHQDVTGLEYNLYPVVVLPHVAKENDPHWISLNSDRHRGEELFRSWPRNNEMTRD